MTKTENTKRPMRGVTLTTDRQGGIVLDRENIVKRTGYRSANDQINEILRAGIRLEVASEEKYANPQAISARHYGEIDMVVGHEKLADYRESVREKIKAKREAMEEAARAAEPAEEPAEEQGGVT